MRVVSYRRYARSPVHIHGGASAQCFYAPRESVVIGVETVGTFGVEGAFLSEKTGILGEAARLERGETPQVEGVKFSEVKVLEVDDDIMKNLIRFLREREKLKELIEKGLEFLKKKTGE